MSVQPENQVLRENGAPDGVQTVLEINQQLAELYGRHNMILWDLFNSSDKCYLDKKLELLMPDQEEVDTQTRKQNTKLKKIRETISAAIWNQRKYNGGNLLMSILYVTLIENRDTIPDDLNIPYNCILPLFRVRKCRKNDGSDNCCMVFIDDNGRVYQNWEDYLDENLLPEGILVAPKNGVYDFNANNEVILETAYTPATKLISKAGNVANTTAGILGLGASAITIVGAMAPIAAPVLIGAAVVGIGSGVYGAASSVYRLVKRGVHEESINVTNSQARADWLGIAGGVVSLGASGASTVLARYAATGRNVSSIAQGTVNGLNVATIAINGVGVGNSAIEIILKLVNDEGISSMDILQLGASLFLVTHSVYNFRTASAIIDGSRNKTINNMREELSNRSKKAFDRTYKETLRLKGTDKGKMDVIRALKNMPDSKQPLKDLYKINKQMNQNGLKASFHPEGKIILNNDLVVDSGTLRQNLQNGIGENIVSRVAPAPTIYPNENVSSLNSSTNQSLLPSRAALGVALNVASIVGTTAAAAIGDAQTWEDCLNNILTYITKKALEKLLHIIGGFYSNFALKIEEHLGRFIPLEEILWKLFKIVCDQCGDIKDLETYIANINEAFIVEKLKTCYQMLMPKDGVKKNCSSCGGYYSICNL